MEGTEVLHRGPAAGASTLPQRDRKKALVLERMMGLEKVQEGQFSQAWGQGGAWQSLRKALFTPGWHCERLAWGQGGTVQSSAVPQAKDKGSSPQPSATCAQGPLRVREICRNQVRFQVRGSSFLTTHCTPGSYALNILHNPELY